MTREATTYKGFEFEFNLNYQPEEYSTNTGEDFEITDITLNGLDATELLENQIEEFDEHIIKELKNYNPY